MSSAISAWRRPHHACQREVETTSPQEVGPSPLCPGLCSSTRAGFPCAGLHPCSPLCLLHTCCFDLRDSGPADRCPPLPTPVSSLHLPRPQTPPPVACNCPEVSQGTFMPTSPQQTCHLSLPQPVSHCCSAHLISTPKESPHPGTFPISPSMMSSASPSTWAQQPPPRPCPICSCSLPFTPCSSSPHLCLPSLKSSVTPSSQAYQTHAGPRAHWLGPPDGPDLPATPPRDLLMFPKCSYSRWSEKTRSLCQTACPALSGRLLFSLQNPAPSLSCLQREQVTLSPRLKDPLLPSFEPLIMRKYKLTSFQVPQPDHELQGKIMRQSHLWVT